MIEFSLAAKTAGFFYETHLPRNDGWKRPAENAGTEERMKTCREGNNDRSTETRNIKGTAESAG